MPFSLSVDIRNKPHNNFLANIDFTRKMQFCVILLCLSVVIVQAQYYPYYRGDLYPYPNYPYPINYHSDDGSLLQYPEQENRIFFNQIFNAITSIFTSTTTTTSTSTTTCTVSTNVKCRRKRFLVGDVEAEHIEPSAVHKVEVTPLAEMETVVRNERKADPQFGFWRVDPLPHEIQSTFGQSPYPMNYNPYINQQVVAADPRFFIVRVITSTSSTTSTFRSTPACSSASNFNQC